MAFLSEIGLTQPTVSCDYAEDGRRVSRRHRRVLHGRRLRL
jgi:hypothetical protein